MLKKAFCLAVCAMAASGNAMAAGKGGSLSYFGRASIKIKTASGLVIYVDPYADGDYSEPADLVLVTHGHGDHNRISLVKLKAGGLIAGAKGATSAKGAKVLAEGDAFFHQGVGVRAVAAYNKNHRRDSSLGFVITFDGVSVYHAGDTDYVPEMAALASVKIDYALFPVDGFYNMGGEEAMRCVEAVKPRHAIAIHSSPNGDYDAARAAKLAGPAVMALPPGKSLDLERAD
jgi:L-ascorbate metabolism protein UlaG (beta-lactamase superfamily)